MLVTEFIAHLSRLTYLLIAVITLADFLRHRDRTRLDIALAFLVPAVNVLVQAYGLLVGPPPPLMSFVSQIMLMAQPHMLLRLVAHFRPVAPRVLAASTLGLALSVLLLALPLVSPALGLSAPSVLFLVAYFAWAEGYASVAFIRGALGTAGVARWRYGFAALGAVLFAAVIVVAGLLSLVPVLAALTQPVSLLLGLISGLAFLLAFAPPRRVRQFWQYAELHHFLMRASGRSMRDRAGHILPILCDMAQRALGGRAAVAALDSGQPDQLIVRAATLPALDGMVLNLTQGPLLTAWRGRRPVTGNQRRELSPAALRLLDAVGGDALCAVPIATPERAWGVLVVLLMRRSLFPDDDLELMRLMAEQAAVTLDQNILLNEQDDLIGHLRERTAQLEAANQELEAFSYSVSHDLRAPLRHVEGFTDLLLRSDPAEPQRRQHLQRISDAAVRMGRLIDSLLTFSRLGRTDLRRQPVQLSEVLAEAQHDLSSEAHGRAIEWQLQPLPEVAGDPDLLRQVFANLLSNALKYSRDRDPARIAVGVEPSAASEVVVYVRDNGVGFDMEYGDKLFGVFQRLHHAEEFEGIGIGLANVRRIIHRHGGRVWAAGQVGGGATFYFALPLAAPARPEAAPQPLPAVPAPIDSEAPGGVSPHA